MTDLKSDLEASFESKTNSLKEDFKETLVQELDGCDVGGSGYRDGTAIMAKLDMLMEKTEATAATAMKPSGCKDNPKDHKDRFDFNSSFFVPVVEEDSFEGPSTTSDGHVLQ